MPLREKRILLAHDESTFRSGEISEYRWMFPELVSFFNKGRGRSIMLSGFIAQQSESDIFMLDEQEWIQTVTAYPELNSDDELLNYFPRSANSWFEPKKDNYFDNSIILRRFERLLKLIKFKKSYVDHQIEKLVDNARTHTFKVYDINLMNKSPGIAPMKSLIGRKMECHCDKDGKFKGLFSLAKELKLMTKDALPREFKLDRLREIFSHHPSFQISSNL
jgi:hypothetical protein